MISKPTAKHTRLSHGYIHIYTGAGKGKTTAALGLALRAVGAGLRVYIGQFMKATPSSELNAVRLLNEHLTVEQFGTGCFIGSEPTAADQQHARNGFQRLTTIIQQNQYGVVIADELMVALSYGLLAVDDVVALLRQKPADMEIVLTGRGAPAALLEIADLVTEMRQVKHYYNQGGNARTGIES